MSDLPEVTEDKLRLVNVVGWGYMLVGATFIALRLVSVSGLIGRVLQHPSEMNQRAVVGLVVMLVMAAFGVGLGGLLIGGGIYLRRRLENARITLIVTSWVLIALSLLRVIQIIPIIMMLSLGGDTAPRTSLMAVLHPQLIGAVTGLLLAAVLGILLALITGPAVKDAMLPKTPPASAVPPPAWPATK